MAMKKCFTFLSVALLALSGCNSDKLEMPAVSQSEIGGNVYDINYAYHAYRGNLHSQANSAYLELADAENSPNFTVSFTVYYPGKDTRLTAGTYSLVSNGFQPGSFTGDVSTKGVSYQQFTSGTLKVSRSGEKYVIEADCVSEDGTEVKVIYGGTPEYRDWGPTGTSTIKLDGVQYGPVISVGEGNYGAVYSDKLYATYVSFIAPADDYSSRLSGQFYFFHDTPTLAPGTYEYPGFWNMSVYGSMRTGTKGCSLSGGVINIAKSGDKYTIDFDNAEFTDYQGNAMDVSGKYTGIARYGEMSDNKPFPTYNGNYDINLNGTDVEGVAKFEYRYSVYNGVKVANLFGQYTGALDMSFKLPDKTLSLQVALFNDSEGFVLGEYTTPSMGNMTFGPFDEHPSFQTKTGGTFNVSVANDTYTVTFDNFRFQNNVITGTYTGYIPTSNYSFSSLKPGFYPQYTGTSTFSIDGNAASLMVAQVESGTFKDEGVNNSYIVFRGPKDLGTGNLLFGVSLYYSGKEIKEGTYTFDKMSGADLTFKGSVYGARATLGNYYEDYPFTSGTAVVSKSGYKYTVTLSGVQTDEDDIPTFNGEYTGYLSPSLSSYIYIGFPYIY